MAPRLSAALVLGLAGTAAACDLGSLSTQAKAIEAECCAGQTCAASGLPKQCTKACAPKFNAFWEDCGSFLKYLPGANTDFTDFSQKCQHQAPPPPNTDPCASGKLLQIMFFDCSNVDNNNPNEFCHSKCSTKVRDFVKRCQHTKSPTTKEAFDQAEKWLQKCVGGIGGGDTSCHSVQCGGPHETQCRTAKSRKACDALSRTDSHVECAWKKCAEHHHGTPPPPPKIIAGCMDKKALNYNPKATVQGAGACVFGGVHPPLPGMCSRTSPYGCKTEQACVGAGQQWISCQMMVKEMHDLNACQHTQGECVRPCSAAEPQNCHSERACVVHAPATQWYLPPPGWHPPLPPNVPPPPPPLGRCERKCSAHETYHCHTEKECVAVGKQWVPPSRPMGSGADVAYMQPGRCTEKCTASRYGECHSQQACTAVKMQWTLSECCGTACPPEGLGRCERPCTTKNPYSCRSKVACESIGRQWVARAQPSTPHGVTCTGPAMWEEGSCSVPCTSEHYYDCKTQPECEAVGMEWHPEIKHPSPTGHIYTQAARCAFPCSIMNSNECDTKADCEGIGFSWVDADAGTPFGQSRGHCEKQCSAMNMYACHSQSDCEGTGGQWRVEDICDRPIIEPPMIPGGPGGGGVIIDPGFGGPCMVPNIPGQPPSPPAKKIGRCEPACSATNLGGCHTQEQCAVVLGVWHAFPGRNGQPSTGGSCQSGCNVAHTYECHDSASCASIGGQWKAYPIRPIRGMPPPPPHYHCDVAQTHCDLATIMGMCASSTSGGLESYQVCEATCGRFITEHYDQCRKSPPAETFTEQFGPIVRMCKTIDHDPNMQRCASNSDEAVMSMNRVCCTDDKDCEANGGVPTKCTGDCADAFLPYFEKCGPLMMTQSNDVSSLGKFYETCTASHGNMFVRDSKLCSANDGTVPWVAIEFREGCSVFVKYVDKATGQATPDFVRLVSAGSPPVSAEQLLATSKEVCKKNRMVKSFAEDFSGIMTLSNIDFEDEVILTVNHPATGNTDVVATMSGQNRDAVEKQWRRAYNVRTFNPELCGGH